jgi:hypothetical protein
LQTKAALAWIGISFTGWLSHWLPWQEMKKRNIECNATKMITGLGQLLEFVAG